MVLYTNDKRIALEMKHIWDALFCTSTQHEEKKCFSGDASFPFLHCFAHLLLLGRHLRLNDGVVCVEEPGTPSVLGKFSSPPIYTAIVSHVTNITNRKTRGEEEYRSLLARRGMPCIY